MDYYDILGVDKKASQDEINAAFRQKARAYHPDVSSDPNASEKFKEVSAAYEVLNNPEKRARYDGGGSFERTVGGAPFNIDPFEFFRQTNFNFNQQGRDRGRDARASVTLTFEEAALGCKKDIPLKIEERCDKCDRGYKSWDICSVCNGSGEVIINASPWMLKSSCSACQGGGKTPKEKCDACHGRGIGKTVEEIIPVDIPAGIEAGFQIRVPGKGQPGITGQRGTLFVDIEILAHPYFTRQGCDITCNLPVTYTQLVSGDSIVIPTLTGKTKFTIPPGTPPSRKLRLRGLGCVDVRNNARIGDLFINLDLDIPKEIDENYKTVLKKLKDLEESHLSAKIKEFREKIDGKQ